MINIKETQEFPATTRTGRVSAELQQIIDCLLNSANSDKSFVIEGVTAGNSYNSMQQRIRTQAKKLGLRVKITHDKANNELFFKAMNDSVEIEVASVKGKNKKTSDTSI